MMLEENRLYSLSEVAEITGLKLSNLRIWACNGGIQAQKVGRAWYLSKNQIKALLGEDKGELKGVDLSDIERRLSDLLKKLTGKELDDADRGELRSILYDFSKISNGKK